MPGLSYLIELIYKSIIGKSFKTVLDPNLKENQAKNLEEFGVNRLCRFNIDEVNVVQNRF